MRTDPFIGRELQRTKAAIQRTAQATAQGRADALAKQKKPAGPLMRPNAGLAAANDALSIAQDDQMFYGQYRKDVARMTGVDIKRNPTDPNLKALQTAGRVGKPDPFAAKSKQFEQNILMSQAQKGGAFGPDYGSANAGAGNVKAQARNQAKSADRTANRLDRKALKEGAGLPERTPTDQQIAEQKDRKRGIVTDARGNRWFDAGMQQTILGDAPPPTIGNEGPVRQQPTQATTFRSMGASHDPLDMEQVRALRPSSSPLDDILRAIGSDKGTTAPAAPRKGLIDGMPAKEATEKAEAVGQKVRNRRLAEIMAANPGMSYEDALKLL